MSSNFAIRERNADRKKLAPKARKSLAQDGAAGGVLGTAENKSESHRDDRAHRF